ncbi:hypothetical protein ACQRCP_04755 [Streptococcus alactolyticus]|nr:hypothetical protein [uncultured Streptococcus sp.]MDD7361651.1 hypothetical protein [Streptococcus alactolyticus]
MSASALAVSTSSLTVSRESDTCACVSTEASSISSAVHELLI